MHTNPEVLALLALGEHTADAADRAHLDACAVCRDELETLSRLINPDSGGGAAAVGSLDAPSEAVWAAIQAELGFIPVTRSWPTVPETARPEPAGAQETGAEPAGAQETGAEPAGAEETGLGMPGDATSGTANQPEFRVAGVAEPAAPESAGSDRRTAPPALFVLLVMILIAGIVALGLWVALS